MTEPNQDDSPIEPCFLTEEMEAEMIAAGVVFELPTYIRLPDPEATTAELSHEELPKESGEKAKE